MSPDLVNHTISTNLNGAFFAVQAAAQQMSKQEPQGGSIIGISSISALVGGAGQTHYTPTKAGTYTEGHNAFWSMSETFADPMPSTLRYSVANAKHCVCAREIWHSVQCSTARHYSYAAQ